MKILFISLGDQPDYQCDCLYHGLKALIGKDLESTSDMWYMYETLSDDDRGYLYGKGFTLYGLLKSDLKNVPKPQEIISKIETHYYDHIIFGAIIKDDTLLNLVINNYAPNEIIFVDGEDSAYINKGLLKKGTYFKRELKKETENINPISFGIPKEKIIKSLPEKIRNWAINYPGKLNTYIYNTEESYYSDYQRSKFAVTIKKEGWDCLRHYEILANGCIPNFKDIENCPVGTMVNFPKGILNEINNKIDKHEVINDNEYQNYIEKLLSITAENLTTEAVVKSMLKTLFNIQRLPEKQKVKNPVKNNLPVWNFKIDKILKLTGPANNKDAVLVYSGVSSVQGIRFLIDRYSLIYAADTFGSALNSLKKILDNEKGKVKFVNDMFSIQGYADTIILDFTLPYQENIIEYLLKVKSLMNLRSRLILIVPNFQTIITLFAFIKSDFRFGRIKLSKRPPMNFYSKKAIYSLLTSFGLRINDISRHDFENSHFVKRLFNKVAFLKFWNCKTLIIEAFLNEE